MNFRELPVVKPELLALGKDLGSDRIRHIVSAFYALMKDDLLVGFFFDGKDLGAIADAQTAFLLRAMGLSPSYSGKPPAHAHHDLAPILSGHFDRRLKLLDEILTKDGLTPAQRRTWIGFENAFRDSVVSEERALQ